MKDNKDNAGKIILSLLIGATAGAVAGLLLAPEAGEETRANLKKSAAKLGEDVNKLLQKGQESIDQAKTNAAGLVEQGRTAANDALASLSAEAQGLAGKATDLAHQATEQAKKVADEVSSKAQALAGTATDKAQAAADTVTGQAKGLVDQAKDVADKVTGQAKDLAGSAADKGEDVAEQAETELNSATAEAKHIVDHAKTATINKPAGPQPTPKVDPIEAKAHHNANTNGDVA
ncbi:hypothetical protein MUN82_01505 [Hymenobacter aerilatus]|uniref:YtxH domain-containing protein n=1 Tax=Hymenobacter aerilatus TaxID=2932251 RepID=A0A8T9SVK8_9BACT|nr:YtxH domain-containing protein [Hymenobacter aerilatus]UOR05787.1 hypothetical protein MUN82_01505 [Hymenobacter aerilatus]